MATDITSPAEGLYNVQTRPLAIFDKPLNHITTAIAVGNKLRQKDFTPWGLRHHAGCVRNALAVRNEQSRYFLEADAASGLLFKALGEKLDHDRAIDMVTALYTAIGIKAGDESAGTLAGSLDMLESDGIGEASGLWRALNATPASLALACRTVINTAIYPTLRPGELRKACIDAGQNLRMAHKAADDVVEQVRTADAILLAFDYGQWERAYQSPQSRPVLARMLELHDCFGDGEARTDECEPTAFEQLVERERAKLAIDRGSNITSRKAISEHAPQPKKIAAARKRSDRKRGPKPKRESEGGRQ